jgi:hypothetical protein
MSAPPSLLRRCAGGGARLCLHAAGFARGLILASVCRPVRALCRLARGSFTSPEGPCVPHRHVRGSTRRRIRAIAAVPGGRPFSADSVHEVLRPTLTPAPVPPRRNALRCIRDGTRGMMAWVGSDPLPNVGPAEAGVFRLVSGGRAGCALLDSSVRSGPCCRLHHVAEPSRPGRRVPVMDDPCGWKSQTHHQR